MGPTYVWRAYQMDEESFYKLHQKIEKYTVKLKSQNNKKKKDSAKNEAISTVVRLSIAIRFFASGNPCDISVVHGISHKEVYRSVWCVVDAIN
jgi:hypothetical protein